MKLVRKVHPIARRVDVDGDVSAEALRAVHGGGTPLPAIFEGTPLPAIIINPALLIGGTPLPAIIGGPLLP